MGSEKIYMCSTYHHVLISVIKTLINNECENDILICQDIPEHKHIMNKLDETGLFKNVFFLDRDKIVSYKSKTLFGKIFIEHRKNKKRVEKVFKIDLKRYESVNIFHDGTKLGEYLQDKKIKYHLIEDGLNHFQDIEKTPSQKLLVEKGTIKYFLKKYLGVGYLACGQNKYCQSIEVNENKNLKITHKKIIEVSKESMFKKLTDEQKKIVLSIFIKNDEIFNIDKNSVLILTIPLYNDNYVDKIAYQIEIYRDIIEKYLQKGYKVLVKPHPRDYLEYKKLFENVLILDKNLTIEVLNLNYEVIFTEAVAINSSSIKLLKNVNNKIELPFEYLNNYYNYLTNWSKERLRSLKTQDKMVV